MTTLSIIGAIVVFLFLIAAKTNRVDDQLRHEGLYPPAGQEGTTEQIHTLIQKGYKIQAIKLYREMHKVGLKEAKEAVEKLTEQQPY